MGCGGTDFQDKPMISFVYLFACLFVWFICLFVLLRDARNSTRCLFSFIHSSIQLEQDKTLTCAKLETDQYGCNCRGCTKCGDCTQKCSMRDESIKGSHDCETWYRMDPDYDEAFLRNNAVVTGTGQGCNCEGCNGNLAISFCHNDIADPGSTYMDINTAKSHGKVGKMRVTINDDMLDPDYCRKNEFCAKHTCLEVRCFVCDFFSWAGGGWCYYY